MKSNKKSFLSKFYGVFTIKMENMGEITCYIINNLVGLDFADVTRIYDLKGSKLGRKVNLADIEIQERSGLKVLKDMNFIDLNEKMDINLNKK